MVGTPDKEHRMGQVAVANIILRAGAAEDTDMLKDECGKKILEYCVPKRFVFVKEFPYSGAGKVDYRKLEEIGEV